MKNKLVNIALKNDLRNFLKNPNKIAKVWKGDVSGASIEIEETDPQSFSSYTYYENEKLRDEDFEELQTLIKENNEKN